MNRSAPTFSRRLFLILRVKPDLGQFSQVFWGFTAPGLLCSSMDLRSTTAKLPLPCVSSVFWTEGSTFSAIAALIAC